MSTPGAKIEVVSPREAILAVGFVFAIIAVVALVQAGIITNPLTLGIVVTLTVGLVMVGYFLVRAGVLSRHALPLWYILTFGVVMIIYGGIMGGAVPAAFQYAKATTEEIALANALFYTLVIAAVAAAIAAVYVGYRYYKKKVQALGVKV